MSRNISLIDLCIQNYPNLPEKEIRARIMRGQVFVNGEKRLKPGEKISPGSQVEIIVKNNFFSRGALKMAPVLDELNLSVGDLTFIDAGASTGGFTQCLLQKGAAMVFAVDVGYNQLAYSLRNNRHVVVWERKNIMDVQPGDFDTLPDAAVCDLSFRSISGAAGHILSLCKKGGWLLALIKPQFEWKNPAPSFDGVISDEQVVKEVLLETAGQLNSQGLSLLAALRSPQKGAKGNQEYFFLLTKERQECREALEKVFRLF